MGTTTRGAVTDPLNTLSDEGAQVVYLIYTSLNTES